MGEGPKSVYVLATAPRLSGGSQIFPVLATAPRLSGGSQICFCACYCTTSVWRVPNLFLCLLMHHVYLCLPGGSQPVFVLTNAPRLSVVLFGSSKSVLSYLLFESISSTS